jgi:hypothetical protein
MQSSGLDKLTRGLKLHALGEVQPLQDSYSHEPSFVPARGLKLHATGTVQPESKYSEHSIHSQLPSFTVALKS